MTVLRTAFLHFWPGFEPENFLARFPLPSERVRLVPTADVRGADLVVFSCFPGGHRNACTPDPAVTHGATGVRLFYTAENIAPDLATCDFAMSFRRDADGERHLRVPNYVGTQNLFGFGPEALLRRAGDPAEIRRSKTRFCTYVQGNSVRLREEFVRRLSRHRRVDCAGPSLNNTGFVADRRRKYELYRESKFAVTFENEAAPGYTSEKLPDALLMRCVPIYWGDPTVELDFQPGCFLNLKDFPTVEALVARVAELDRDDAAYEAMLAAPCYPEGRLPAHADPARLLAFFERVASAAGRAGARRAS
ncbi:MAG: glycosyltransferase family 10 [Planctomycetota bacterium]